MIKKLTNLISTNKNVIYYVILMVFITLGSIYAIVGYFYYQETWEINNANDLLHTIFTPFVLAILRFLIVTCLGLFVTTVVVAIPLRRIKLLQFEVEFSERASEIATFQNKQMNQLHFLHRMLEEDNYYLGSYFRDEITEYESIAESIISSYESFFNEELETNLHIEIIKDGDLEEISKKDIKRLIDIIRNPDKEDYVIRNDSIIRKHMMLIKGKINGEEVYIVMSSSEYEFGVYEMKIILSLLELSRMIREKITILDTFAKDE